MSDLTEALDRILNWLRQARRAHPEATQEWWLRSPDEEDNAPFLNSGLSRAEIQEITKDLSLQVPQEVYDLYSWGNGTQDDDSMFDDWLFDAGAGWGFFMGFGFYPLQMAVAESLRWKKGHALTIFHGRECKEGYLAFDKNQESFPVVFRDFKGGADDTIIKYASLTSMMVTIAECYEEAYYINQYGYFSKDENKALHIWQKYNCNSILSATLNKMENLEAKLPALDANTGVGYLEEIAHTFKFTQDPRLIELLLQVLKTPPTNTTCDENLDYFRARASTFLTLAGCDIVPQLLDALKNQYWLTRYWAAITLGHLKDQKAVSALNQAKHDSDEMVREAALKSLAKITNPTPVAHPLLNHPGVANLQASAALQGIDILDMLNINPENLEQKNILDDDLE